MATLLDHRLHVIDGRSVLIVDRFDRLGQARIGYVSALTMLERADGESSTRPRAGMRPRSAANSPSSKWAGALGPPAGAMTFRSALVVRR
ncbi:MAG: hypothetical protein ACR2LK_12315, partial [Solirubrobacteraceae bacterium]